MDAGTLAAAIGRCCSDALTAEVTATPKPGLVDRRNSGAHKDMDLAAFRRSITAISPFFPRFALAGMSLTEPPHGGSLGAVRPLGVECEAAMLAATGGVNTHKGAIFSLGLLAAAAGYRAVHGQVLAADGVCAAAAAIAQGAVGDFTCPLPAGEPATKGLELYRRYGVRGIRGEAAEGFPSVRAVLPELRMLLSAHEHSENAIYLQILLRLMAAAEDTNVASRCGMQGVKRLHADAQWLLAAGGALAPGGLASLTALDDLYIRQNMSPGGCADLLSAALTLAALEQLELGGETGLTAEAELLRVLDAREHRWRHRQQLAEQCSALVTVTLCLPIALRTRADCAQRFRQLCEELWDALEAGGARPGSPVYADGADGPACFLPTEGEPAMVKGLCVAAEETLPGGRILDADVMNPSGVPVGRETLGLPPRRCMVCGQAASVCVSRRLHPRAEVEREAEKLLAQRG